MERLKNDFHEGSHLARCSTPLYYGWNDSMVDLWTRSRQHESSSGLLELAQDTALSVSFVDPRHKALILRSLIPILNAFECLSDGLLEKMYDDDSGDLLAKEFPHLYVVLDDRGSAVFRKSVHYLQRQTSFAFVLDGIIARRSKSPAKNSVGHFRPMCAMIATAHFVFVFDWKKLGSKTVLATIGPWLKSPNVHKLGTVKLK